MTTTPSFPVTPRPARRAAQLLACSALALQIATAVCLRTHASIDVILTLPLLAVICVCIAIGLTPATRYEAIDTAAREEVSRGLWELEVSANRGPLV